MGSRLRMKARRSHMEMVIQILANGTGVIEAFPFSDSGRGDATEIDGQRWDRLVSEDDANITSGGKQDGEG